jgi:hypothetical protein
MRPIHPAFQNLLNHKDESLIMLYHQVRKIILDIHPEANELLYYTHALTSVYSITEKMGDGFCHIPIYTNHLNLGFNKGSLLKDPKELLEGTGKFIRHIPIRELSDLESTGVKKLIETAVAFSIADVDGDSYSTGLTINKIKH